MDDKLWGENGNRQVERESVASVFGCRNLMPFYGLSTAVSSALVKLDSASNFVCSLTQHSADEMK